MMFVLLFFLLLPVSTLAATPTHDATSVDSANNTQQNPVLSGGHTRGSGQSNWIVVCRVQYTDTATSDVSSVTYAGNSMTQIGTRLVATAGRHSNWFYYLNPASGNSEVQVNFNEVINESIISCSSYYNVDQSSPLGTEATATSASTSPITVAVTSAVGELVIDNFVIGSAATGITVGASQTQRQNTTIGGAISGGGSEEAGAASVTMSWTFTTNSNWATRGVALKPSRSGVAPLILSWVTDIFFPREVFACSSFSCR